MMIYSGTLTANSVSVQSDEYGMRAYVNSARGRAQLESECPADIVQEVEAIWGSTPTITEPTLPTLSNTAPSAIEQMRADIDYLSAMTGVSLT